MFVFVNTVTMRCMDYEISAQFYHSMSVGEANNGGVALTLLGKRISINYRQRNCSNSMQLAIRKCLLKPNLKLLMKPSHRHFKHSYRTFNFGNSRSNGSFLGNNMVVQTFVKDEEVQTNSPCTAAVALPISPNLASSELKDLKPHQFNNVDASANSQRYLTTSSSADETVHWLTSNRFSAYLSTFASFSGADLLRLSRDDLIQICGLADGIRLFNALHSKVIAPKLTIYVCIEQSTMFHALYLNSLTTPEFGSKLSTVLRNNLNSNDFRNVQGYFIQGPNGIHIHINDDVIQNLKNEAMYTVETIATSELEYRVLLKPLNV